MSNSTQGADGELVENKTDLDYPWIKACGNACGPAWFPPCKFIALADPHGHTHPHEQAE
jgi:hypothetical protein